MGAEFAAAAAIVGAITEGGQVYEQEQAEKQEISALDTRAKEMKLQYNQKTLSNYNVLQNVLDKQVAEATVKGVSLGSASLNAIQRSTFNIAAKNQKSINDEEDIFQQNIKIEKQKVRNSLYEKLFSDTANTVSDDFDLLSNKVGKGS